MRATVCSWSGVDLHAGVVVIELAVHSPALGGVEVADPASPRAAWRPWPTCSGPVGLAETNSTRIFTALGLIAEPGALREHLAHHLLPGSRFQANVQKPGPAISMASTHC